MQNLFSPPSKDFKINTDEISSAVDDHTIGVVAIMGNHYGGTIRPRLGDK